MIDKFIKKTGFEVIRQDKNLCILRGDAGYLDTNFSNTFITIEERKGRIIQTNNDTTGILEVAVISKAPIKPPEGKSFRTVYIKPNILYFISHSSKEEIIDYVVSTPQTLHVIFWPRTSDWKLLIKRKYEIGDKVLYRKNGRLNIMEVVSVPFVPEKKTYVYTIKSIYEKVSPFTEAWHDLPQVTDKRLIPFRDDNVIYLCK